MSTPTRIVHVRPESRVVIAGGDGSNEWDKDPSAILDWMFDWSYWLPTGDTVTSHVVTVTPGIVKVSDAATGSKQVTVWLSGGTVGGRYAVSCHVVTTAGRADTRTFHVCVRKR